MYFFKYICIIEKVRLYVRCYAFCFLLVIWVAYQYHLHRIYPYSILITDRSCCCNNDALIHVIFSNGKIRLIYLRNLIPCTVVKSTNDFYNLWKFNKNHQMCLLYIFILVQIYLFIYKTFCINLSGRNQVYLVDEVENQMRLYQNYKDCFNTLNSWKKSSRA